MSTFGKASLAKLQELDPRLQEVLNEAIKHVDFTIICGHRSKEEQDKAVSLGNSKVAYPNSKHNSLPSKAVDVALYPINWGNTKGFCYLAGIIMGIALAKGIKLKWGGDWNLNGNPADDSFQDLPHLELIE